MKKLLLLSTLSLAFCAITQAQTLDQSNTNGIGDTYVNGPYGPSMGTGETFTAGITGQLSEIQINVASLSSPGILDVRVFAGSTFSGTTLALQSFYVTSVGIFSMYLNPGVSITNGSQYTFILSNPGGPTAGDFSFVDDFNGTYAGGTEWYLGNSDPTRDLWFKTYVGGVGIEDKSAASLQLVAFPNPCANLLNIVTDNSVQSVQILDLLGNSIKNVSCKNGNAEINLGDLPDGIYFVEVRTATGLGIRKVVKD